MNKYNTKNQTKMIKMLSLALIVGIATVKNTDILLKEFSQIIDKPKYETKLKQLEKLETKIEHNLTTHKNNLDFFEQNDNCPTCTQKIEEKFRDEKITKERKKVVTLNDGMKDLLKEITNTFAIKVSRKLPLTICDLLKKAS